MKNLVPTLKSKDRIFDGYFKIDEKIFTFTNGDGEEKEISRLQLNRPNAVAVLIYNEEKGTFTFVRQFRPAIAEKNNNEPIVEIAAGLIDEGETPLEAAKREVIEETGYKVDNLELLYEYYPGVGYCSEYVYVYLATVREEDKVEEGGGLEIEGEMMEIVEMSVVEAFQMLYAGEIKDGKTIMSLQEYKSGQLELLGTQQYKELATQEQKIKDLELKINILERKPRA